jgi:hypothetical protein
VDDTALGLAAHRLVVGVPMDREVAMRVVVVERGEETATVVLRPCWLARLFGARETVCEIKHKAPYWITAGTERTLGYVKRGSLIEEALDFHPVAAPPRAIARRP